MNIAYYIPTFNRPSVLQKSLETLLNNTDITPNEVWIIDDGSSPDMRMGLAKFSIEQSNNMRIPFNLIQHGLNYGIGYTFERIYNLMRQNDDLDIACIMESDYIWRKDWLKDCLAVLEASPNTLSVAGTDHPDMYDKDKTHRIFPEIMTECFGKDLARRNELYVPYDLQTDSGVIKVQGVSNSCGCSVIYWKRLKEAVQALELAGKIPKNDFWRRMDRAFNKGVTHDSRKNASDGWMSSTVSMFGEMYMELKGETNGFPFLSICDYSLSEHLCGGGVNGLIVPEGQTFVHSPKWKQEYLEKNPRL
jgi:glycosyltransferase involved in cell wall biosynthesis